MMGIQESPQGKLFYTNINLGKRIRDNHPLRRIDQFIDPVLRGRTWIRIRFLT
jgi:hypothetical protein